MRVEGYKVMRITSKTFSFTDFLWLQAQSWFEMTRGTKNLPCRTIGIFVKSNLTPARFIWWIRYIEGLKTTWIYTERMLNPLSELKALEEQAIYPCTDHTSFTEQDLQRGKNRIYIGSRSPLAGPLASSLRRWSKKINRSFLQPSPRRRYAFRRETISGESAMIFHHTRFKWPTSEALGR